MNSPLSAVSASLQTGYLRLAVVTVEKVKKIIWGLQTSKKNQPNE
jgi:hypothetical protein